MPLKLYALDSHAFLSLVRKACNTAALSIPKQSLSLPARLSRNYLEPHAGGPKVRNVSKPNIQQHLQQTASRWLSLLICYLKKQTLPWCFPHPGSLPFTAYSMAAQSPTDLYQYLALQTTGFHCVLWVMGSGWFKIYLMRNWHQNYIL